MSPTLTCLSTHTVLPQPETETDAPARVELTPWELLALKLHHIQLGLVFSKPKSQEQVSNHINQLKTSYARTLHYFYPLAGRLATETHQHNTISFYVDTKAVGAQFIHASADVTLDYVLNPIEVPSFFTDLLPFKGALNHEVTQPLLGVQVTELIDGIFIGISMNHALADGGSIWHFINSWSAISRNLEHIPALPIFKRWFINETDLPVRFPLSFQDALKEKDPQPVLVEQVFNFTSQKVAELKQKANIEKGSTEISTFQALLAHTWIAVTRARNLDPDEMTICGVAAGNRQKLNPPLPDEYFGNPVGAVGTGGKSGEVLENGLGWAAWLLNQAIKTQHTDAVIRSTWKAYINNPELLCARVVPPNLVSTGSSPRYDVYGNDFGWGRPVAVRLVNTNFIDGGTTVHPGAVKGTLDVQICLSPQAMKALDSTAFIA